MKTADDVQAYIERSPYLSWLGLKVIALEEGRIEVTATWRPEWVANPDIGQTQGGIVAALVDFAANFALVSQTGGPVPTIDIRIDYLRMAKRGELTARGRVVKFGRQISISEAELFDGAGTLLAAARGTFSTAPRA